MSQRDSHASGDYSLGEGRVLGWNEALTSGEPRQRLIAAGALLAAKREDLVEPYRSALAKGLREVSLVRFEENLQSAWVEYDAARSEEPPEEGDPTERFLEAASRLMEARHELALSSIVSSWVEGRRWDCAHEGDARLRAETYRFCALNEEREERLAGIAPEFRSKFPWYFLGHDVPKEAVQSLGRVAHLVARFPEAMAELEELTRTEAALLRALEVESRTSSSREVRPIADFEGGLVARSVESGNLRVLELADAPLSLAPAPPRKLGRALAAAAGLAAVVASLGAVLLLRAAKDKAQAEKAHLQAQLDEAEARRSQEVARLKASLTDVSTMNEAQRATLQAQLEAAEKKAQAAAAAAGSGKPAEIPMRASGSSGSNCAPGDPMCGGL